ncbi:MAG: hypothetical protein H0V45_03545 [Actinobacteria bacterium]|nr:hypothetical protein [Actinomycetota bacterium]
MLGSHFKLRGFARAYRVLVPEGAGGTFNGRFVLCTTQERCEPAADEQPQTREKGENARERPAAPDDEEIPTVDELAELLAGK